MRTPGVEPGSQAWEACMMPLHYVRHECHDAAQPSCRARQVQVSAESPGAGADHRILELA